MSCGVASSCACLVFCLPRRSSYAGSAYDALRTQSHVVAVSAPGAKAQPGALGSSCPTPRNIVPQRCERERARVRACACANSCSSLACSVLLGLAHKTMPMSHIRSSMPMSHIRTSARWILVNNTLSLDQVSRRSVPWRPGKTKTRKIAL